MNSETLLIEAFKEPTSKQEEFYRAKTRYVGYGGARGGGKSHAVRCKATLLSYEYPGIKILIIRKSFPELRRNYVRPFQQIFANFPENFKPIYSDGEKAFNFPNESLIELGYCDTDGDVGRYIGNEWDILFLDEATQLSEYQYGALNSCIRGVNKFPKRTYLTCNPGGIGHGNVKRLFIDKKYHKGEHAKDYTFIQARVWDNLPLLMSDECFVDELKILKRKLKTSKVTEEMIKECMYASDYVRSLDNLPDNLREAWLNGDWNVFSGKFFTEFDTKVHVCEPFVIPSHWRKSAAIDYGLDRFAVLWFAVDEKGQVYCYRNYEESNLVASSAARILKEMTQERIEEVIAPPDLWNRHSDSGKSTAEIFAENGLPLVKAGNERIAGWLNVKEYLKHEGEKPPKMIFFDSCRYILEYIPLLQYDIKKINDVDTEPHKQTHSPDALRYWCSRWQLGTEVKPPPTHYDFDCLRPKENSDFGEVTEEYLTGGY